MPRPCLICSDNRKLAKAAELISAGNSDQAVANTLNALTPDAQPMSYMAVSRHRRMHIMKATQDRLAVVSKGAAPRQERQQLAAAAAAGAPTPQAFVEAFFGLKAQAEKVQWIEDRLERMAAVAEENKSPGGVATVAAQQLRSVETGARLAGTGGYAPQKAIGAGGGAQFVVNFTFSGGRTQTITAAIAPPAPAASYTIDGVAEPAADDDEDA
jgi:hypothetical protein